MAGVLVIDDDPAFRGLACRLLTAGGLAVVGEADGVASGMSAALALRPDAALVDLRLGDGDGLALALELLALPWHPHVVLTSTDADAASDRAVRQSGLRAFVPKDDLPNAPLAALLT